MLTEEEKLEIYKKLNTTEKNWLRSLEYIVKGLCYSIVFFLGILTAFLYIYFSVNNGDGTVEFKSFMCTNAIEDVE